jgi:CxxC-x17-CxxC domain-containing protein
VDEFAKYNERFATEAIAPIQNKVGQFLSASIIRNIVGQVKSTIDMREIMDNRKIFIMNLAKGRIGEDASALLGGMLVTRLQLAAMGRVDVPEQERKDFYLYVDEFQNFATLSFANILSEARKYRLNLILAHQYIEQLAEEVAAAVFGNVGTIVSFRVGAADAEVLEKEFAPTFTAEDLVNLTKYDMYLKLMINGVASSPFSAIGLPPITGPTGNKDKVVRVSRERYAKPREIVEEKIARWSGMQVAGEEEKSDEELEAEIKKSIREQKKTAGELIEKRTDMESHEISGAELEARAIAAREAILEGAKVQAVDFLKYLEEAGPKKEIVQPVVVVRPAPVVIRPTQKVDVKVELKEEVKKEESKKEPVLDGEMATRSILPPAPFKEIEKPKPSAPPVALSAPKAPSAPSADGQNKKTREELFPYEIKCSACGKPDRVSFNPDPNRPVYCKDCLKTEREKERQTKKKVKNGQNRPPRTDDQKVKE